MDKFTPFLLMTYDDVTVSRCELTINNIVLKKFLENDPEGIKAINIQFGLALREILKDINATEL